MVEFKKMNIKNSAKALRVTIREQSMDGIRKETRISE